ncbi:hypothetical protein RDV84_19735 [Lysobacter yananisis]|uniref:Uncharacterized protein n=1 Tax=Lysobacter yananisis TaxID=1003114 RepID=A0ABY9P5I5_9GAMM|nr:hypothetical protein [Lysobacter yananisis]WMT02176.1 hypothetical protein RDV84_19735 [Lysobacter yananisis]
MSAVEAAAAVAVPERVRLPLAAPSIDSYPQHAYYLSVMELQPGAIDWICSNYLQLSAFPAPETDELFFFDFFVPEIEKHINPWLSLQKIDRRYFAALTGDPVAALRDALARGHYPKLPLDEFHVPGTDSHQRAHYPHPSLLHGYDEQARAFEFSGYLQGRYAQARIGYDALRRAVDGLAECGPPEYPDLFLVKPQCNWPYPLDPVAVGEGIADYLGARNSMARYRTMMSPVDMRFGVDVYEALRSYALAVAAGAARSNPLPAHLLYEHKRLMARRVRRLLELGTIGLAGAAGADDWTARADAVAELGLRLRAEYLKLHRRPQRSAPPDALERLIDRLRASETALLGDLLAALKTPA